MPSPDQVLLAGAASRLRLVTPASVNDLWAERRRLFLRPFAGYGARAAHRGDKLTRRVCEEIRAGGFIALELVTPTERLVVIDDATAHLEFDLHAYPSDGRVQLLAAALCLEQTTNMRAPGGGFPPVCEQASTIEQAFAQNGVEPCPVIDHDISGISARWGSLSG